MFGFVFGLVSAFSPEYYLALVGFGLGGGFLGYDLECMLYAVVSVDQHIVWSSYQLRVEQ